ncbi:probable mitochondrial RNA pseudouridine synthase Rpusd4 [Coccomyxa sp. Obi]|nr:probable mitochondrial RNA pseudouridine synthase Rpusd4 [Coccomyxa sp. Obi]
MAVKASSCIVEQVSARMYLHAVAVPPTQYSASLGPRVEHILVSDPGRLSEVIATALNLPQDFTKELIRFGAIHWCPVPPVRAGAAAHGQVPEKEESMRRNAIATIGKNPGHSQPQRASTDIHVDMNAYVRVHVHPKRFPNAYKVDWKARIVHAAQDFVVINKPAGVPVVPTVDNILESCLACTAQALGESSPLLSTHRLDTCTEGLVVLGRKRDFVAAFNELLRLPGAVQKFYRALTKSPPPTGASVHYVTVGKREKGLPAHTEVHKSAVEGSQRCELEVLSVQCVQLAPCAMALGWPSSAFESLILLKTGRTHQIRAQLAAEGHPLLGDTMYEPLAPQAYSSTRASQSAEEMNGQGSQSEEQLHFDNVDRTGTIQGGTGVPCGYTTVDDSRTDCDLDGGVTEVLAEEVGPEVCRPVRLLNEPLASGIGLQACRLEVHAPNNLMGPSPAVFDACVPWWREPV